MSRTPGKWPHYAEWHRCDAVSAFADIDRAAQHAQDAIRHGRALEAALLLGDIIRRAADGRRALDQAKHGER